MPYYEFICKCGNLFTEKHSMGNIPKRAYCPECGKKAIRKFSLVSLRGDTVSKN